MGSNPGSEAVDPEVRQVAGQIVQIVLDHPGIKAAVDEVKAQEPPWVAELRGKLATIISSHVELTNEVKGLRAYVEKIEAEAHESMAKFTSPEAMMEMAGKFLGT